MRGEEYLRPGAKRNPFVPRVLRVAVFGSLKKEDWHEGEPVVRLNEQMFCDEKLSRSVDKRRWVRDRRAVSGIAEVAGCAGSVLRGKRMIAAMPFEALMPYPKRVSIRCGDGDRNSGTG